jgi:hypothetical protein
MADGEQNRQPDSQEGDVITLRQTQKAPKLDIIFSLIALALIFMVALCFFLFGLDLESLAGLVFWGFPLVFFFSMLLVPLSLVFGTWSIVKKRNQYTTLQRFTRKCLLITILLLSLSYPIWCICLPVYGVRVHVEITGGVDELQKWSVRILDMPIDEVIDKEAVKDNMYIVRKELYSPQMRKISPGWVIIITHENEEPYLNIPLAGGFFPGWGIRMGRPGFRPPYSESVRFFQWADGIYGYACH